MKKFLNCITDFFSSLAQARAAASLARMHRYEEAAEKMQSK